MAATLTWYRVPFVRPVIVWEVLVAVVSEVSSADFQSPVAAFQKTR